MIRLCCILALLTFYNRTEMPGTKDQGFFYALNPNNAACYPRGKVVMALQYPVVDVSSGKGHAAVIVSRHFKSFCYANTNNLQTSSSNTGSAGIPTSLTKCSKISNRAFPKTGEHSLYLSLPNFQWRWEKFRTSHLPHDGQNLYVQPLRSSYRVSHKVFFGQPVHSAIVSYTSLDSLYRFFIASNVFISLDESFTIQNHCYHAT